MNEIEMRVQFGSEVKKSASGDNNIPRYISRVDTSDASVLSIENCTQFVYFLGWIHLSKQFAKLQATAS